MRKAIGLIGLVVAGGTIPAGWAGLAHAGVVLGGAAGALALLIGVCLVAPALARRQRLLAERAHPVFAAPRVVARTPAAHI
jgi:tellurite resistance protein TehA-like permease